MFLLLHAVKDNYVVNIILVILLNYLIYQSFGPFQMFFWQIFNNFVFFTSIFSNSLNFSSMKFIFAFILISCNSPLIWLSFAFFVAMQNSYIFFSIFSINLFNTKIQLSYFRESLNISIWSYFKGQIRPRSFTLSWVSCPSLELLLKSLFFLSKRDFVLLMIK